MFNKLKDKLKNWIKSSKEKIEETTKETEIQEESKPEDIKKTKKKTEIKEKPGEPEDIEETDSIEILSKKSPKEVAEVLEDSSKQIKEDLKELKKEEIENLGKKLDKKIQKAKSKETEKIPEKFNVAHQKYEPDTEKLEEIQKKSFFSKLKSSLKYKITNEEFNEIFDDLELLLLENNVALEVVEDIKKILSEKLIEKEIKKENLEKEIKENLKIVLNEIIIEPDDPLETIKEKKPFVILFFGINGTGKTTSIAKLAYLLKKKNLSVVLAAADTFRAAAIQQIQEHSEKLKIPLIKHDYGSDPSAVAFDAIKYAETHKKDVVLIDTAGRMHTKANLLNEMEKICRVTNPDLKIFVAESIAGNDATEQAKSFNEMIEIDGSILSKADIDEKGGTIISISHITHKPIFYLGIGQNYQDLKLFNKQEFIESLGLD